jgi:hypothetical protein
MENNQKEIDSISNALENYYFKGIYEGNLDLLNKVFNKGALLFGDVKQQPYAKTLDVYLDVVKKRVSPKDSGKTFSGNIIAIRVINSIAVAEVKVKMYEFNYHELLSFHQINGSWRIVNKMLSDVNN